METFINFCANKKESMKKEQIFFWKVCSKVWMNCIYKGMSIEILNSKT